MKTVADILRSVPVWLNPSHRLETALLLMRAYDLEGLPVLDGDRLAGMVLWRCVLGADETATVSEVMDAQVSAIGANLTLREAAEVMLRDRREVLPVLDESGALLGVLSDGDLLAELRLSVDPITGLSWSDALREWAIDQLQAGREITLLFLDIDDFGAFNKLHGHVLGDLVLRRVAETVRSLVDPTREVVCRYGGDEFCIASLRDATEASVFGGQIVEAIHRIQMPEIQNQQILVTLGMRGGKRTREREHVHYVAMLNNLINLASRDCMEAKSRKRVPVTAEEKSNAAVYAETLPSGNGPEPEKGSAPRGDSINSAAELSTALGYVRLKEVRVVRVERTVNVRVQLEERNNPIRIVHGEPLADGHLGTLAGGTARITYCSDITRTASEEEVPLLVAEATADALRRLMPHGHRVHVTEVLEQYTAEERKLVTVVGQVITASGARAFAGTVFAGTDAAAAPALALLDGLRAGI
ncbi:MAG: diguanylate cyclase [Chloroherpetonaceae bacterium]|nr:diguanylate cyclase [Chthonomonadaceae bacterium]MDW8207510.1 diguanylate cyclase [Chloroherpetonaceae bacterium]